MGSRPNIVWITVDSVRQDHTSLAGYARGTTPNLLALSRRRSGRAFSACIAHGFSTRTSTASIFTMRQPGNHGVSTLANTRLNPSLPVVPELLGRAGYRTYGISTNAHVSPETGLNRGFDEFVWITPNRIREIGLMTLAKFGLNIRRHSVGFEREPAAHSSEFVVNDIAKRYLRDAVSREPFFLFAHYNGPHTPYYPPLPLVDEYLDDIDVTVSEARWLTKQAHYRKQPNRQSAFNEEIGAWDEEKQETLRALYDAELRYTDEMVGRLYRYVSGLDIGETIVVITSDHGELLGERGLFAHGGYPLEALINVPLVVTGMDQMPESDALIQHADISHLLCKRAGVSVPENDAVDVDEEQREYAITQAFDPSIVSVRSKQYKYIDGRDGELLYRLPDERRDVRDEEPTVFTQHQEVAEEITTTAGEPARLSEDAEQQLRGLGYLE